MLAKLLKYEIPAVGRRLLPMYIAWLASSVMLGLTAGRIDGSSHWMIIPGLVYFAVTVAVFVMAAVLMIQRYYNSLFGDEAYFNQALPVTSGEHILSKTFTALIWIMLTSLAALISGVIILLLAGGAQTLWEGEFIGLSELWDEITRGINGTHAAVITAEMLVLSVLSALKSILAIYAAITIGHLVRNHVVLASIGAYIGLMVFESTVGNVLISLGVLTGNNVDLDQLFVNDFVAIETLLGISFVTSLALTALYFFICKYFMEKNLNLK